MISTNPGHYEDTSIADALFSSTRQKVLRLFFLQPDRSFTMGELIEQAKAGSGAVQREVARLTESGLVNVQYRGRQKSYHANMASPIFGELSALIVKTLGPTEIIKKALQPVAHEIELAFIYGSVAKQTDRADSDIDVLLVSDTLSLEDIFSALEGAEGELSRPINPTLYSRDEFEKRRKQDNPFIRKVLNGPVLLLKGIIDEQGSIGQPGPDQKTSPRNT
ncbi:nucleotidyltransferase domain-containing protein [Marinobacter sp. GH_1]